VKNIHRMGTTSKPHLTSPTEPPPHSPESLPLDHDHASCHQPEECDGLARPTLWKCFSACFTAHAGLVCGVDAFAHSVVASRSVHIIFIAVFLPVSHEEAHLSHSDASYSRRGCSPRWSCRSLHVHSVRYVRKPLLSIVSSLLFSAAVVLCSICVSLPHLHP
jgi:hypothetical protein